MQIEFNTEELQEVQKHISKYPEKKAAIMPVLWMAQKKWGWLSLDVMRYVSQLLDLPLSHVEGVASFYTMYFKKPMGKYHVQVCTNVSCMLRKGDEIYKHVAEKLGIKHNERSEDGFYSLEEVECMGACGGAPVVVINEDFYENVDISKVDDLLTSLK
ncbi:MAG: NAD(P)H-dependent oxidoreductase subunit E [Candidatus Kapaibacterium sp.]|jgi:NADH-quinone oxidoreductase E subunit|nr:NAD(P)H-dependent oxidoreductase subunit E [Candidatus Kapabacteria bacterium]